MYVSFRMFQHLKHNESDFVGIIAPTTNRSIVGDLSMDIFVRTRKMVNYA